MTEVYIKNGVIFSNMTHTLLVLNPYDAKTVATQSRNVLITIVLYRQTNGHAH